MSISCFSSMVKFAFPPPKIDALVISGSDLMFPVRRIYCVGSNYADHVREMGGDPSRYPPFFFMKPRDAVVQAIPTSGDGVRIKYPLSTDDLHHEVELVVAVGKAGVEISQSEAMGHVFGYAVGVDLTRRDLQKIAKAASRPWDASKGFDQSAPIGRLHSVDSVGDVAGRSIWLDVNGERRQSGLINQMVWTVPEIISILSTQFHLAPGDLIFTGTPHGVGKIVRGDTVTAGVDGLGEAKFVLE